MIHHAMNIEFLYARKQLNIYLYNSQLVIVSGDFILVKYQQTPVLTLIKPISNAYIHDEYPIMNLL